MKRLFSLLLLLAVAIGSYAQLLWKVSGNGLSQPSYIVGSFHVAPANFVDSIAGLNDALASCKQVYGELSLQELGDMSKLQQMQAAMLLPDSVKLQDLFTAEQQEQVNKMLRRVLGTDLTTPTVGEQLSRMKPSALSATLQVVTYVKKHPSFNPQALFDAALLQKGAQAGKTVGGLETMAFQSRLLYESKPLERQAAELLCMAQHFDYQEELMERLAAAYLAQDLKALAAVMSEKMNNECDSTPEEEEALIYQRNADWAKKLPSILHTASTLVVVGSGHLPGERGLLELLRQAGFDVTPVTQN